MLIRCTKSYSINGEVYRLVVYGCGTTTRTSYNDTEACLHYWNWRTSSDHTRRSNGRRGYTYEKSKTCLECGFNIHFFFFCSHGVKSNDKHLRKNLCFTRTPCAFRKSIREKVRLSPKEYNSKQYQNVTIFISCVIDLQMRVRSQINI